MAGRWVTLADKLATSGGRPSGFDYMRLGLSVGVFFVHSLMLVSTHEVINGPVNHSWYRAFSVAIVPLFFALSGFLVAGSLERCKTLVTFLGLRALRIAPALSVEVCVSALIIGPIFTHLPLARYFSSHMLVSYFLNIVGYIHYYLPGVFGGNPFFPKVNPQLWTIPYELECYGALALLAILAATRRRAVFVTVVVLLFVAWQYRVLHRTHWHIADFQNGFRVDGRQLVFDFLAAVALYFYRDRVPWSTALGCLAAAASYVCLQIPVLENLAALPIAYLTVYLGLLNPRRGVIVKHADLSYGIYLFGTPIQQAIIASALWTRQWWLVLLLAGPPTFAIAWLSWTYIERPALSFRSALGPLEKRWISIRAPALLAAQLYARAFVERIASAPRLKARRPPLS